MKKHLLEGTVLGMCIFSTLLSGCGRESSMAELPNEDSGAVGESSNENSGAYVQHDGITELITLCDTKEDAEAIGNEYGITLKEFKYGVATYETDGDPQEIIEYGRKHKLPELSLNIIYHVN